MYIRRLNLTKRCLLSEERKALMHQMAVSENAALINRDDNLLTVSQLAAQLQQNTAEDRQVYYKLARALYRGVRTCHSLLCTRSMSIQQHVILRLLLLTAALALQCSMCKMLCDLICT